MTKNNTKDWEKELKHIWNNYNDEGGHDTDLKDIIDFISDLLKQKEKELDERYLDGYDKGYDDGVKYGVNKLAESN